ncbi:MAG TPA: biotin/lipoyl-containing protein [Thermoanaerobaculia bacterium]|nr:biotin/lipoyl-containing protein [Thermoanaerobaculia bacterium]
MELIVRRGGPEPREERVRVRRLPPGEAGAAGGEGYEVAIGGRTWLIDAAKVRAGLYSLLIGGAQHEVAVRERGQGSYQVSGAWGMESVEVADPLAYLAGQGAGGKAGARRRRVTAYMPGRVVAVLAAEGEAVTAGQGVVVLEAMKMQNEIQAEQDGILARVLVQPGQSVDGGDPLFELE